MPFGEVALGGSFQPNCSRSCLCIGSSGGEDDHRTLCGFNRPDTEGVFLVCVGVHGSLDRVLWDGAVYPSAGDVWSAGDNLGSMGSREATRSVRENPKPESDREFKVHSSGSKELPLLYGVSSSIIRTRGTRSTYPMKLKYRILAASLVLTFGILPFTGSAADKPDKEKLKPYTLKTCIVSGEKLGEMGKPVVEKYKDREIKFCCKSCIKDFKKEPDKYVKMIDEAEAKAKAKESAAPAPAK